jgi:hypothetical protein
MISDTAGTSGFTQIGPTGAGYASHSLDELKLLAASIDTGRIEQMQGKFSDIARHLGEVAASLATLRNDLPNWWHGPMADATVERVAQVIDHAHSAQDTADGASKALSTCAQVVAAQQEAMKSVPEVADPNTAVQTEPLTPVEPSTARLAAMAAHQQAYSAARAEAARHVDGIAAQYVETTAQLQNTIGKYDEGFVPSTTTSRSVSPDLVATASTPHTISQFSVLSQATQPGRQRSYLPPTLVEDATVVPRSALSNNTWTPPQPSAATPEVQPRLDSALQSTPGSDIAPMIIAGIVATGGLGLISSGRRPFTAGDKVRPGTEPFAHSETGALIHREAGARVLGDDGVLIHGSASAPLSRSRDEPYQPDEPYLQYGEDGRARFGTTSATKTAESVTDHGLFGAPSAGVTRAVSEKEERGKRPNYLKEPRSSWLSNVSAAPHDGVLNPDWDSA